jgi:hypothetical protein
MKTQSVLALFAFTASALVAAVPIAEPQGCSSTNPCQMDKRETQGSGEGVPFGLIPSNNGKREAQDCSSSNPCQMD